MRESGIKRLRNAHRKRERELSTRLADLELASARNDATLRSYRLDAQEYRDEIAMMRKANAELVERVRLLRASRAGDIVALLLCACALIALTLAFWLEGG